jgi:hypothetical protein
MHAATLMPDARRGQEIVTSACRILNQIVALDR